MQPGVGLSTDTMFLESSACLISILHASYFFPRSVEGKYKEEEQMSCRVRTRKLKNGSYKLADCTILFVRLSFICFFFGNRFFSSVFFWEIENFLLENF